MEIRGKAGSAGRESDNGILVKILRVLGLTGARKGTKIRTGQAIRTAGR